MTGAEVWEESALDPRDPDNAVMRASDRDREVVRTVLTEAYADGRLDQEELDERASALAAARTLGQLPPLITDLVPSTRAIARRTPTLPDVHTQAVARYRGDFREAVAGFIAPTLICWVIWAVTMLGGFPWPAIVTAATLANLARVRIRREDIIADHERSLHRKAQKALDKNKDGDPKALDPRSGDDGPPPPPPPPDGP